MTTEALNLEDGRVARRVGNKRRMLAIGLKLMQRTRTYRVQPRDITDAAELHPRSFHAIFGDLDGFYSALIDAHEASLREMIQRDVRERDKTLPQLVLLGR